MALDNEFNKETLGRLLIRAAHAGEVSQAVALLEKGAPVDVRDEDGNTPLLLAAQAKDVIMAGLLLGHGAAVDARNDAGKTPLWLAAQGMTSESKLHKGQTVANFLAGGRDAILLLLDFDADPLLVKDADYRDLLIAPALAEKGMEKKLRDLLDAGMSPNLQTTRGESLLLLAAEQGHEAVAALLIERGARVNHKDTNGRTVLRAAMWKGDENIVNRVLDAGADTGGGSENTDTGGYMIDTEYAATRAPAIHAAVSAASVKFELHKAAKAGDETKIAALAQKGVPLDVYDRYGLTALMYAVSGKKTEAVKLLLAQGANPNLPRLGEDFSLPVPGAPQAANDNIATAYPLHIAIVNGDLGTVRALLARGARTDLKDSMGQDAIVCAEGWLNAAKLPSAVGDRAEILRAVEKGRSHEIAEMARSAVRLKAPTQGLKRPTFGKKEPAP